ncbi:MAG: TolB family protein, partial [Actinomycetota bacterium]
MPAKPARPRSLIIACLRRPKRGAFLRALVPAGLALLLIGQSVPAAAYLRPGRTIRVSIGPGGKEADGHSTQAVMTPDARFVVFTSRASNLVEGDSNGWPDVFVVDRSTGALERVSEAQDGTQADHQSYAPGISADGRYVAFISWASNLAAGDTNGFVPDVFVRDRLTGEVELASGGVNGGSGIIDAFGNSAPSLSADGRYVVFATNPGYLGALGTIDPPAVYLFDRDTGATERIDVSSDEEPAIGHVMSASPSITADGRYVAFQSDAPNLDRTLPNLTPGGSRYPDVYVRDRVAGTTELVSIPVDGGPRLANSLQPRISADGRCVAFESSLQNLVPEDPAHHDIFVRDLVAGTTERISVSSQ